MKTVHAHELVVKVAKEMASELYEELARNDVWYQMNPDRTAYVEKAHGSLIEQARQVMAMMLSRPSVTEYQKEVIFDALTKDAQLRQGRQTRHGVLLH